jgi:hypothetical protein
MDFPFSKPLSEYTNDELISLFAALNSKIQAILSEGRSREMLYFLRNHEQIDLINEIFHQGNEK